MDRFRTLGACGALFFSAPGALLAQVPQNTSQIETPPPYSPIARQIIGATFVIDATIRSAVQIRGAEAVGLMPGRARFYVQADISALIRGAGTLPARIGYLVDVPLDSAGRPPRLRRARVLLFANPVPGMPSDVQLIDLDGQRLWTPATDALVRRIATELVAPDAPPAITGIGNAFHVTGTLPGEGETQIFLNTTTGAPISLQVLRRPGQAPRWSVSLGDIVDDSAGPPARDTLLWFRLACGLPPRLPESSLASEDPSNARTAREDYRFILNALGPCGL